MSKIKTHVLMVSRTFPASHKRKGEKTEFIQRIRLTLARSLIIINGSSTFIGEEIFSKAQKLHTIRGNKKGTAFENWSRKIKEVQEGKAILSLRYWSGSPYNYKQDRSKQIEFAKLDKNSGVGVQKLEMQNVPLTIPQGVIKKWAKIDGKIFFDIADTMTENQKSLAKNDGLSLEDFNEWFKECDNTKPFAIIHFTNFRY